MFQALIDGLREHGDGAVALGPGGGTTVTAAQLLRHAAAVAAVLPDRAPEDAPSEVAFSFEYDRAACAAALLATWSKGHVAALPEDGTRDGIAPLISHPEHVAFLQDTGVGLGTHVPTLLAQCAEDAPALGAGAGDANTDPVVLAAFLQPPIGAPTVARWTSRELLSEVDALAGRMDLSAGQAVISSLSPTALPGLLLGLLAPLRRGAIFATESPRGADALAMQISMAKTCDGAPALIVTPAHARALARRTPDNVANIGALYCSDEGLDPQTLEALSACHDISARTMGPLALDTETLPFVRAISDALLGTSGIDDAAVAVLSSDAGQPTRVLVAIASEAGGTANDNARASAEDAIRNGLPADLPFGLRLVPSLPRNENGRLPDWRVLSLFKIGRNGHALVTELDWATVESEGETEDDGVWRFRTRLPENYGFFEGHYTTYAVLAGAAQLHELALPCIRRVNARATSVCRMRGLKFLARIEPLDELDVVVRQGPTAAEYDFEIVRGETRCSAGRIVFAFDADSGSKANEGPTP